MMAARWHATSAFREDLGLRDWILGTAKSLPSSASLMLRRPIVAVALCGLLAGCSGVSIAAKPKPTQLDRTVCQAFGTLPSIPVGAHTLRGVTASVAVGGTPSSSLFADQGDPVMARALRAMQANAPSGVRQIQSRCKALGL